MIAAHPSPRTVLVADPKMTASISFATHLRGTPWTFAGTVSNGKALLDAAARLSPWVVVLDLALPDHPAAPGVGWATAAESLGAVAPASRIAASCDPTTRHLVPAAQASGARAWIEKPYTRAEILSALTKLEAPPGSPRFHPRARRVARSIPARLSASAVSPRRSATIGDVSETGVRFSAEEETPVGSVVGLEFDLPGVSSLRLRAQVVRRALAGGAFSMGAVFVDTADHVRERISQSLARLLASDTLAAR